MRKVLERCPSCGAPVEVTQLSCTACETIIHGHFTPCPFCKLSPESVRFAELFVRLRGNVKEMERELVLSYPTVRGRLNGIIRELGFEPDEEPQGDEDTSPARQEILARLEQGTVNVAEAVELLKKVK